jgi:hypothetical protein
MGMRTNRRKHFHGDGYGRGKFPEAPEGGSGSVAGLKPEADGLVLRSLLRSLGFQFDHFRSDQIAYPSSTELTKAKDAHSRELRGVIVQIW